MKDTLASHERDLFKIEREQFVKDNKVRDDYLESQKVHYESALEIERLKATILKMGMQPSSLPACQQPNIPSS